MPRVSFPQVLQRHFRCSPVEVAAATVREALDAACATYPGLSGYLLDESGALRAHVTVFVDGVPVRDRLRLSTPCAPQSRIDVLQALSGG